MKSVNIVDVIVSVYHCIVIHSVVVSCIHCINWINFRLMGSSLLSPKGILEFRNVLSISIDVSIAIVDWVLSNYWLILFAAAVHSILSYI